MLATLIVIRGVLSREMKTQSTAISPIATPLVLPKLFMNSVQVFSMLRMIFVRFSASGNEECHRVPLLSRYFCHLYYKIGIIIAE